MRETVRLIHTADWHWGLKSWKDSPRSKDRNPEIRDAIELLLSSARDKKPDYILIAGDLFNHYTAPSDSDAKEVLTFLVEFSKIAPVIVVLGNHDWRGLATYHLFSSKMGIHILSTLDNPLELDGIRIFYFPYFPLRRLLREYSSAELQDEARKLLSDYKEELKKFARNDKWNVLVGHFAVEGVSYQNEFTLRSELFVPLSFLSSDIFDYAALGHIHSRRRIVGASAEAYYSGSLVRVGFGEEKNDVGALWVELCEGKVPEVRYLNVNSKKLRTYDITLLEFEKLSEELASYNEDAYIRVVLRLSGRGETCSASYYRNRIFNLDDRIVKVIVRREERSENLNATVHTSGDMVEMFRRYLKMRGIESEPLVSKFRRYYRKAEEDEASQVEG